VNEEDEERQEQWRGWRGLVRMAGKEWKRVAKNKQPQKKKKLGGRHVRHSPIDSSIRQFWTIFLDAGFVQ